MSVINIKPTVINVVQISDIYIVAYLLELFYINDSEYTCSSSERHDCEIRLVQRES